MNNIIKLLEVLLTWPIVVLIICLASFFIFRNAISLFIKNIRSHKMLGKSGIQPQDGGKDNTNKFLVWGTFAMVIATFLMVRLTYLSNERTARLFIGQNKPLIDVSPIRIIQRKNGQSEIYFSVTNYSGFDAYDIAIDAKYGEGNAWISEWRKARNEKERKGDKKGVVQDCNYPLSPKVLIEELKRGETADKDFEGNFIFTIGSLSLEKTLADPCSIASRNGYLIFVRVTWKNKKTHGDVFDEIHKYKLICTRDSENKDPGAGRAFTLVPEGIISQKDMANTIIVCPDDCNSSKHKSSQKKEKLK